MDKNYGHLEIRLAKLLEEKGLNRYRLSLNASMNWKQVERYCTNDITRLDTFVLCKLCTVLECDIHDLLAFIPAGEKEDS